MKTAIKEVAGKNKEVFKSLVGNVFPEIGNSKTSKAKVTMVNPNSIIHNVMNNRGETQSSHSSSVKVGVARNDLLESVKADGIREPLILFRPSVPCPRGRNAGKYKGSLVLIDGHNRLRIADYLGFSEVPAFIHEGMDWDTALAMSLALNDGGDTLKRQLSNVQFIYAVQNFVDGMKVPTVSEIARRFAEARLRVEGKLTDRRYLSQVQGQYKLRVEIALSIIRSSEALTLLKNNVCSFALAGKIGNSLVQMKYDTRAFLVARLMHRYGSSRVKKEGDSIRCKAIGPSVWISFCNEVKDFSSVSKDDLKRVCAIFNDGISRFKGEDYRAVKAEQAMKANSSFIVLPEETLDLNSYDPKRAARIKKFYKWALACYKNGKRVAVPKGRR